MYFINQAASPIDVRLYYRASVPPCSLLVRPRVYYLSNGIGHSYSITSAYVCLSCLLRFGM